MNAVSVRAEVEATAVQSGAELSVIVPTFNERENVLELVRRLHRALAGVRWEVIFVDDDSPDGTASLVRELGQSDTHVRCVQRVGRRGLSSACVEGMLASSATFIAVIDADLQHDERLLPAMLKAVRDGNMELAIGSRYVSGGGIGEWEASRAAMSRLATRVSRLVVPADLRDPMSGFFMLRRSLLEDSVRKLSSVGFKILLDIFASVGRPVRFVELPYTFRPRHAGESKLDSVAAWDYGMLMLDKLVGHVVPAKFLAFCFIGGMGAVVHLAVLALAFRAFETRFLVAQVTATAAAMTFNYAVNNLLTFRDRRRRGTAWLTGWMSFATVCSMGALANVGIASFLYDRGSADWIPAALAGIFVGAVWNFAVSNVVTWGSGKR